MSSMKKMNNEIDGYDAGHEMWPSSSSHDAKGMFGCEITMKSRGLPVPDFLSKTFRIVSDPNTDSIISWGRSGDSFVIWDHIAFSEEILPKYFKHSNLSSFVYQLNNYCFRKIGVDHQWEYENPNFQAGKQYLLSSITKRTSPSHRTINIEAVEIKTSILRNGINESKLEIEKLKTRQSFIESHVKKLESQLRKSEGNSRKLRTCWAAACDEIFKMSKNNHIKFGKEQGYDDGNEVYKKRKGGENRMEINNMVDYGYLKRIILQEDDDLVCENEVGTEMANKQAKIAKDLENLIANMSDQD